MENKFNWDADSFFRNLSASNKLAKAKGFLYKQVSGLQGFEDALASMMSTTAFICLQDEDDGYVTLEGTPHTRRVKTVFFAMRHAVDNMQARAECFDIMREIFRQFMSKLIMEKVRIAENGLYLDQRVTFHEIEQYFFSGCACAYFNIAVDVYTDMRYNSDEWDE